MSPLPELDLARIRRFVDQRDERISPHAREQIRIELDVDAGSAHDLGVSAAVAAGVRT